MAAKKFNYVFEDLRRPSSPVNPAGFTDFGASDEDTEVDVAEEDADKAVRRAAAPPEGRTQKPKNGAGKDAGDERRQARSPRDERRREALANRRAAREVADEAIEAARGEVAEELGSMRKELTELKGKDELAAAEANYTKRKGEIEEQIEKAMEKGEHAKYAKLNSELIELNNDLQRKRLEIKAKATTASVTDLEGRQPGKKPLVRIQRFLKNNSDWWADPDHEDAVAFAKKLDKRLVGELQLDPNSDEYWEKFNRNFDKKFPDLRVKGDGDLDDELDDDEDDELEEGQQRGNQRVVAPANRNGGGGGDGKRRQPQRPSQEREREQGQGSRVRLSAEDKANMRLFGLDPGNPEHLVEYAKNKVQDEAEA